MSGAMFLPNARTGLTVGGYHMADLEFSREVIEGLTQKLASLWSQFSPTERALLLAIFGAAARNAKPPDRNQGARLPEASDLAQPLPDGAGYEETLAHYQQQLLTAYTPGNSFGSITEGVRTPRV
jgi:hypothetical protein